MSAFLRLNLRERFAHLSTRARVATVATAAVVATGTLTAGLAAADSGGPAHAPVRPPPASASATPSSTFSPATHAARTATPQHTPATASCDAVPVYKSTEMPFHDFSNHDSLADGDKVFRGHLFDPHERILQHKVTDGAAQPAEFDSAFPHRVAAIKEALAKGDKDVVQLYTYLQPGYSGTQQMDVLLGQLKKEGLATAQPGGKVKLHPGIQLMLDYEQAGLKPSIAAEASERAFARTGQWPVLYASSGIMSSVAHAAPHDSLIVANYNGTEARPGSAVTAFTHDGKLMFQWYGGSDKGQDLDRDVARGYTQNELRASVGEKKTC